MSFSIIHPISQSFILVMAWIFLPLWVVRLFNFTIAFRADREVNLYCKLLSSIHLRLTFRFCFAAPTCLGVYRMKIQNICLFTAFSFYQTIPFQFAFSLFLTGFSQVMHWDSVAIVFHICGYNMNVGMVRITMSINNKRLITKANSLHRFLRIVSNFWVFILSVLFECFCLFLFLQPFIKNLLDFLIYFTYFFIRISLFFLFKLSRAYLRNFIESVSSFNCRLKFFPMGFNSLLSEIISEIKSSRNLLWYNWVYPEVWILYTRLFFSWWILKNHS